MAIDAGFINEKGPFMGVSCLSWKQRGEGVRAPLAINVDFSRGSIRPRAGSAAFHYPADPAQKFRVLGLSGYKKRSGESLVVWVQLGPNVDPNTEHPWMLSLKVFNMDGTQLLNHRLDRTPFFEQPDPDNWYTMAQYNDNLFISSKMGRTLRYNFEEDPTRPFYAVGKPVYTGMVHVTTYPQGEFIIEHKQQMVIAGFDGVTSHKLNVPLSQDQTLINEELLSDQLRDSVIFPVTGVMISDAPFSDAFIGDRFVDFPSSGRVTGLASTRAGLLVMTENSIHRVDLQVPEMDAGLGAGAIVTPIAEEVGCVHHRSIVQGRGLTAWLVADGFYIYDGEAVRSISDDISDLWGSARWQESPLYALGDRLSSLGYPFVLQRARMDRACGAFDANNNMFTWAVPIAGYEDFNRLILTYNPATQSWSMHAPTKTSTGTSSFRPTNFATIHDRGRKRLFYSDYDTGIYVYNESAYDFNWDKRAETDWPSYGREPIRWVYQGPEHDMGPGGVASVRALQMRQKATASRNPCDWHIETERNFDMDDGELDATGAVNSTVRQGPPFSSSSAAHYFDDSASEWGTSKWHRGSKWRARYSVGALNGNAFTVAFTGDQGGEDRDEIFDYSIEIQQKRDTT